MIRGFVSSKNFYNIFYEYSTHFLSVCYTLTRGKEVEGKLSEPNPRRHRWSSCLLLVTRCPVDWEGLGKSAAHRQLGSGRWVTSEVCVSRPRDFKFPPECQYLDLR